jgi:hypothetical protein
VAIARGTSERHVFVRALKIVFMLVDGLREKPVLAMARIVDVEAERRREKGRLHRVAMR